MQRDAGVALVSCLLEIKRKVLVQELAALNQVLLNDRRNPLNVLELGSGCGIVGIALTQLFPCNVTLTDLSDSLDMLEANIDLAKPIAGSSLQALPLDWFDDIPSYHTDGSLDLILISDCIYNSDTSPALVHTLVALSQEHPEALIVVSLKRRHASEAIFFDLMSNTGLAQIDHLLLCFSREEHVGEVNDIGSLEICTYRRTVNFSGLAYSHRHLCVESQAS